MSPTLDLRRRKGPEEGSQRMFGCNARLRAKYRAAIVLGLAVPAVIPGPSGARASFNVDLCAEPVNVNWAVPMPPPGFVTEIDWAAGPDCTVSQVVTDPTTGASGAQFMTTNPTLETLDPVANPEGVGQFSTVSADGAALPVCDPDNQTPTGCLSGIGAASTSANAATTTQTLHASVHQRSWDCCGIAMNEYDLQWWWTYDYRIRGYKGNDFGQWHRESNGGGWYVAGGTEHLGASANYSSAQLTGSISYGYQGGFDPSGQAYYNSYSNTITGYTNGSWGCAGSWSWRRHFSGWHIQTWCAWGDSW